MNPKLTLFFLVLGGGGGFRWEGEGLSKLHTNVRLT